MSNKLSFLSSWLVARATTCCNKKSTVGNGFASAGTASPVCAGATRASETRTARVNAVVFIQSLDAENGNLFNPAKRFQIRVYLCPSVVYSSPRETDFVECQRPARRAEETFSGISRRREARRFVFAGNQMHAGPGGTALARELHDILELCREKGLLRHGHLYEGTPA